MEKDNGAEILDFTDYAKPTDFKFQDVIYRIPAFNKNQIEKLMVINKRFIDIEEDEEDEKKETDVHLNRTKIYFEIQDEFIATALLKKVKDEFKSVEASELNAWPVKVKNKVMSVVSDQMSTTVEEEEPEKKS